MRELDANQEPSYNLLTNLLLLPRILKMIEDMVDDSTPLLFVLFSIFILFLFFVCSLCKYTFKACTSSLLLCLFLYILESTCL